MCSCSIDRICPPPSWTFTRHCAQVPPPPQALDTKIPASASAVSSLPPAGTSISFWSLTKILTGPLATSWLLATRINATNRITSRVNTTTPSTIVIDSNTAKELSNVNLANYNRAQIVVSDTAERHERQCHQPDGDERNAQSAQGRWNIAVLHFFTDAGQ